MVEPSEELKLVFEKAVKDAKNLNHEYVTLEHLLFSLFCSESLCNIIKTFGGDIEYIKSNLEHHLKNNCNEIITDTPPQKPKKTQTVERVLNRAFTQTLFSGRSQIDLADVVLSVLAEKKSVGSYYLEKGGINKDKFSDYLNNEIHDEIEEEEHNSQAQRALKSFTVNLNKEAENNKIDPVIGREDIIESVALSRSQTKKQYYSSR